ncbi:MAG: DUF1552 domain-containing protein [Polyangiaceae bacterium]|nr:DUF1552 domain-containing protein [Polyangiaceae bacterium]
MKGSRIGVGGINGEVSRRKLLFGASALTATLLPMLGARAEGSLHPKNILFVYHPNGLEPGWEGGGASGPLVLNPILSALEPFKSQLVVCGGIKGGTVNEVQAHSEGTTSLWTGSRIAASADFATHASVDQLLAPMLAPTPFRTLEFGVQSVPDTIDNSHVTIYSGAGKPIQPEDDPNAMFARVFSGGKDPATLARLRSEQKSVFDLARTSLDRIRASYGIEERAKLDAHEQALRDVEKRLDSLNACPTSYQNHQLSLASLKSDDTQFETLAGLQTDLLVNALSCGLTSVASLQYSYSTSMTRFKGQPPLHSVMHSGTTSQKVEINRWFVEEFARLLQKLSNTKFENGASLLDETLVVWGSEMAVGNHLNAPIPFILAGGGTSGFLKLGRWVNLTSRPRHTRLLATLFEIMGVPHSGPIGDFTDETSVGILEELSRA